MATLCQKSWTDYKSPLRVVTQFLLRSRGSKIRRVLTIVHHMDFNANLPLSDKAGESAN